MAVELDDLARHRDVIPLLAAWHVREWQHLYPEWTVEAAIAELEATTSGAVPHTIVAFDGRGRSAADVAGSVSIIDDDELDGFEHVRPWLASVYVRPPARRAGLGTRLVTAAVEFASGAGIDRLHLLTADECEFYARLGWRRVADADKNGRHVTVMRIDTDAHAPRRALAADWCTNPWFRCAYSYLRADGTPADRDVLAAAAAPGLMLAGEAASRDHPGTAHGAWFSGERAAREVCATAPARVLVVGAGLAGIAAARVARECGAAVTVLEATSRIGGRAASSRRLGGPVNVGAAWMHGTTGHPLFDVFSRRGRRIDADTFRDTTTFVAGRGELAGAELASLQRMSGEITRRIAAATRSAACGSTVAEVLDPAIDDVAVDGVSAAVLQSWFRGEYENLYAAPPSDLSLRHAEEPFRLPGPDLMITVATDELVAELAEGVAITYDAPVRAVTRRDGPWCVATDDGELLADAVIVTVSVGVLKSDAIVFDPPLAPPTRDAIGRIGAGLVSKAFFAFDTAFWAPHRAFWVVDDPAPEFELWVDVSTVRDAPTLCAFAVGADAVRVERMSEEDLLDLGRTTLLSATGLTPAVREPRQRASVSNSPSGGIGRSS